MFFEASARLESFKAAAQELNVTESAVSRQIALLEDFYGHSLFIRTGRGTKLNNRGKQLKQTARGIFEMLVASTREMRKSDDVKYLTIAATTTFCSLWLMPRLKDWNRQHPDIPLHMITDEASPDIHDAQDISIVLGYEKTMGFSSDFLFSEEIFPVCSPEYLADHPAISDIKQLVKKDLVDLHPLHWKNKTWSPMSWDFWLSEHDVEIKEPLKVALYNHFPMVLDAAREGLGVALAWKHLAQADLERGTLVRPVEMSLLAEDRKTFLIARKQQQNSEEVLKFKKWILDAFRASEEV